MTTAIVLLCLFLASSFTAATWVRFVGGSIAASQFVALSLPALFVSVIFISVRHQHAAIRTAGRVTSLAMGFLNFAFIAALACWPVVWIAQALHLPVAPGQLTQGLFAMAMVIAAFGVTNAATLRVTRYTVRLPNLPAAWRDREVALVSDIHVGVIWGLGFVRQIVARLQQLRPTAIFISGDMFDGAKVDIPRSVEPWTALHPPGGIYFVTGNHDEFGDPAPYLAALTQAGIRVLHNERVSANGLQIVGFGDSVTHQPALYRDLLGQAQLDRTQPSILLAHRPAHLEIPADAGITLQLSGHTHAGQFPLWTQLVRQVYGRFSYGLNRFGSLQIVTSSGAGSGGPPLRVGTRSEIVILRLEEEQSIRASS